MAWLRNRYRCDRCDSVWTDEWSCACDDDCPLCGARHMSPEDSDDLTLAIAERGDAFLVLRSPPTAEHHPDYVEVGAFTTRQLAETYLAWIAAR